MNTPINFVLTGLSINRPFGFAVRIHRLTQEESRILLWDRKQATISEGGKDGSPLRRPP